MPNQRDFFAMLERQAHAIRTTSGGVARVGFAPLRLAADNRMGMTPARLGVVAARLAMVFNWHWRNGARETDWLAGSRVNAEFNFREHPGAIC